MRWCDKRGHYSIYLPDKSLEVIWFLSFAITERLSPGAVLSVPQRWFHCQQLQGINVWA